MTESITHITAYKTSDGVIHESRIAAVDHEHEIKALEWAQRYVDRNEMEGRAASFARNCIKHFMRYYLRENRFVPSGDPLGENIITTKQDS